MDDFLLYTASSSDDVLIWCAYASLSPLMAVLVTSFCRTQWAKLTEHRRN